MFATVSVEKPEDVTDEDFDPVSVAEDMLMRGEVHFRADFDDMQPEPVDLIEEILPLRQK